MYRLVISDDEMIIRKGLASLIDWEKLGFEIVGCFEDGRDVIAYTQRHIVDVILCDVEMLEVSGLEVASWMLKNRPEVVVVIISGYKEFDYVKEALKYKVEDYILKPIKPEEIDRVFGKIRENLDKSRGHINAAKRAENDKLKKTLDAEHMIERVKEYIDVHISEELSLELLADTVYMSKSHFARMFRLSTGCSVMDYVISRRIEVAKNMLRQGERSLMKIANAVGYRDLQYFQRSFKKYTGFSVKEYQRTL